MKRASWSMLAIDTTGLAATLLLLGLGVWSAWPRKEVDRIGDLTTDIAAVKNELNTLRGSLEEQKKLDVQLRVELSASGRLPDQSPQEVHLQILSNLAAQNYLTVTRQLPLAPREYPGLLEQRFAFEVTGSAADLGRFFHAVETSSSWTDVSFLKLDRGKSEDDVSQRNALLTFSAFSMAKTSPNNSAVGQQGG